MKHANDYILQVCGLLSAINFKGTEGNFGKLWRFLLMHKIDTNSSKTPAIKMKH